MFALWHSLAAHLPFEWAQYAFMRQALLTLLLAAPIFALLGGLVVSHRMAFFSDVMGHAALTGLAIGTLLGLADPGWAMLPFAAILALGIVGLRRWSAASTDTILGLVMSFAVALGLVLLSRGGQFSKYSRYLVGDLLTITPGETMRLAALAVLVLGVWLLLYNRMFLTGLNRSLARSRGVPVWTLECVFATVIALVVTVSIPWVGLLVINSLLLLPAAAARNLARNTAGFAGWAVAASLVSSVAGLILSYRWNTATGATIVLVAMAIFLVTLPFRKR